MKKIFYFAASALMLMACAKTEELGFNENKEANEGIKFEVYSQRANGTKAGTPNDITNENIGNIGFGVFAYYTAGEQYDNNAKPNFMYNQKVTKTGTDWTYEPVKYWPNEYGNAAYSDETDYVTFFAYAPWTKFEPTTGAAVVPAFPSDNMTDAEKQAFTENQQKKNIISVNKNNISGDPIVKYVVDTDPATSVDLLWGVAASNAAANYSTIDKSENPVKAGFPFINLVKPGNPVNDKISFNLKHSLAKVKFTIDYIADDFTPDGNSEQINADETRIFVRSFTVSGWATKGALNLNNTTEGEPLWKDFDGVKDLSFNDITFNDGRKDGKEGTDNGAQTNEENQGLNPNIIENWAATVNVGTADKPKVGFGADKNDGVTLEPQLLFGGDPETNGGYFYVIPRNEKPGQSAGVDVTIVYDVETIDPKLAATISDGETHGTSVENVISKKHILGEKIDFEAGKQYLVKIHIGMTSVKIEAVVTDWVPTEDVDVDLPDNQNDVNPAPTPGTLSDALAYAYDDFTYDGTFAVTEDGIAYTPKSANQTKWMNDMARMLGAIHRVMLVDEVTYSSDTYAWDEEKAGNLKGSNFYNDPKGTLVSVITAYATANQATFMQNGFDLAFGGSTYHVSFAWPTVTLAPVGPITETIVFEYIPGVTKWSDFVTANSTKVEETGGVIYYKETTYFVKKNPEAFYNGPVSAVEFISSDDTYAWAQN